MTQTQTTYTTARDQAAAEQEYFWYIFAGHPGVLVKEEVNPLSILRRNAMIYANMHRAAIWAIGIALDDHLPSYGQTAILAWPSQREETR